MKHKVTLAISVVLIVAAAVVAINVHNEDRHDQAVAQAKANKALAAEAAVDKSQAAAYNSGVARLQEQCNKDHQLFVANKGKTPSGDCNPILPAAQ